MAKRTVNYKGIRWLFFANLAGRFNPDIADALENKTWTRRDKSWTDLQKAVQQPYLDPIARAISDMTGEDFDVVRQAALEGIRQRVLSQPRGQQPTTAMATKSAPIFAIEPFVFFWANLQFIRRTLEMITLNPKEKPFWLEESRAAYADKLERYLSAVRSAERWFSQPSLSSSPEVRRIQDEAAREAAGMDARLAVTPVAYLSFSMAFAFASWLEAMQNPVLMVQFLGSRDAVIRATDRMQLATRYCVMAAEDLIDEPEPQWIMKNIEAAADDILRYPPTPSSESSGGLTSSVAGYFVAGAAAGAVAARWITRT